MIQSVQEVIAEDEQADDYHPQKTAGAASWSQPKAQL
jgi:hypothetical protein